MCKRLIWLKIELITVQRMTGPLVIVGGLLCEKFFDFHCRIFFYKIFKWSVLKSQMKCGL